MKNEIFKLLEEKVNEVYLHFQDKLNIRDGGIHPEVALRQDEILEELAELIDKVLTMEKEWEDEQ